MLNRSLQFRNSFEIFFENSGGNDKITFLANTFRFYLLTKGSFVKILKTFRFTSVRHKKPKNQNWPTRGTLHSNFLSKKI